MEAGLAVLGVLLAVVFAFTVGLHDASGAIATSVATRALAPLPAVTLAAGLNFVGALLGERLAYVVATGLVTPPVGGPGLWLLVVALGCAIAWNLATLVRGLPSSTSHALIAAMVGAALPWAAAVNWGTVLGSVLLPLLLTPVLAFGLGYLWTRTLIRLIEAWALRRARLRLQQAQVLSAAAYAVGHGLQSGQKSAGVVFAVLIAAQAAGPQDSVPVWVRIVVAAAIAFGTFLGGWQVVRTIGHRLADLDATRAFGAESLATVLLVVTIYPLTWPVSTTQVITSAVSGAAATNGLRAVRALVAGRVIGTWLLTFPVVLGLAAGLSWLVTLAAG